VTGSGAPAGPGGQPARPARGRARPGRLRLGVIGIGTRSTVARQVAARHLPADIVAVCDPAPARRDAGVQMFPGAQPHASISGLLDAGLDGVFVTTPDHTHEAVAVALLEAGVPVFVEKPLAITTAGCDRILDAARRTGVPLYVGHNMRHLPVMRAMRDLVLAGEIGEVKAIWCRHFVSHGGDYYFKDWHADRRNSTSLLLQKGAHDIDAIHWLAGSTSVRVHAMGGLVVYGQITARGGQGERRLAEWNDPRAHWPPLSLTGLNPVVDVEDLSMMTMQLASGVFATYEQCHFTPDYWRSYTVIGTRGRLENFGDLDGAVVKVWNSRRSGHREDADIVVEVPPRSGGHGGADAPMVAEFVTFLRDGIATQTSPAAAREAVAAACAATQSLRSAGVPVGVPPLSADLRDYFDRR
jgi:predicted dehydrogenase